MAIDINLNNVQEKLVSGTNIKTVNGQSLLGSGDITVVASEYRGPLYIADTPTLDGKYDPMDEGTYPNAGGLTYLPSTTDEGFDVAFILSGGVWSKNRVDISSSSNFEQWESKTYAEGDLVIMYGYVFKAKSSILATENPYISNKWEPIIQKDVERSLNLLDYDLVAQKGSYTQTGSFSPSANTFSTKIFNLDQGTYTISGIRKMSSSAAAIVFFNNGVFDSYEVSLNRTEITFTMPATANSVAINLGSISGVDLEDNEVKFKAMLNKGYSVLPYENYGYISKKDYCFIDSNGDDISGNGTLFNPYKTVKRCNERGFYEVVLLGGVYRSEDVNPVKPTKIRGYNGDNVEIWGNTATYTSKTLEPTYTNVYKVSDSYVPDAGVKNLWINDLPDEETLITTRYPFHGNKTHRLSSTKVRKGTSLSDLESSIIPKWVNVGSDLFISNIGSVDLSVNNIIIPSRYFLSYYIYLIESITVKYISLRTQELGLTFSNSKLLYCADSGIYNYSTGKKSIIINSEIAGGHNNGAGYGAEGIGEEINCWFHDWDDEGSSAHEKSKVKREGSIYSNNVTGVIDVGSAHTYIENCLFLDNGGGVNFTYSPQGGEDTGNAIIVNSTIEGDIGANISGRVTLMNTKVGGTVSPNISVI